MAVLKRVILFAAILIVLTAVITPIVLLSRRKPKGSRTPVALDVSGKISERIKVEKYGTTPETIQYLIERSMANEYKIGDVFDGHELIMKDYEKNLEKAVVVMKFPDGTMYVIISKVDLVGGTEKKGSDAVEVTVFEFAKKQGEAAYSRVERRPIEVDLMNPPQKITKVLIEPKKAMYNVVPDELFSLRLGTLKHGEQVVEEDEEDDIQKIVILDTNGPNPKVVTVTSKRNGQNIERVYELVDSNFNLISKKAKTTFMF
ncbi:signal peptide-containing protein [Theileria equi strain WA]|uniref:Signal peptide-containing protein n=1 Tax=Theileria equi strain WA TaxID=1537102 RepID=L0AXU4_THEEQ|nr:signal peptide-containing protein [Theileria equi strain WA]AFZ80083.1 signal peptide-containing protein [Theileria equi strain WA]|eukprot:XP_004829749.1 signal peptide-containing protein [Theileria equi strain WA]